MSDVQLDHVCVKLGNEPVVKDVSVRLDPGKLYILVGPNGAGKTTLLRAMAALLSLQSGHVFLNGRDVAQLLPSVRAGQIAYLPQDRTIAWDLPCVDIAALGAHHLPADLGRQQAFAELVSLGLQEVSDRGVFGLSGGQRARVLLARVLVTPAEILLLDEPLIALDPAWQRQVLLRLKEKASQGKTVILSLHDLHLAAQFADEVLLMHEGRLVRSGLPEDIFIPELLREVFNLKGELLSIDGHVDLRLEGLPLNLANER